MELKNEIIKSQIMSLQKEHENISHEIRQIGFNDMNWGSAEMNASKRLMDIENRIDNLLMQIL